MKKQLILAIAAAAGFSASASAGILSSNAWQVLYEEQTITLSANASSLYFSFTGSTPPGTPGSGETINVTQFYADNCVSGDCAQLKNYTLDCAGTALGDPGTVSTLLAITMVNGNPQEFSSTGPSPGCSIEFGDAGQIVDGWIVQELFATGAPGVGNVYGVQLWGAPRRTITWKGGSCDSSGLSNAAALAAGQAISAKYDELIATEGSISANDPRMTPSQLDGTGCTTLSVVPFSLGYCDPLSPFSGVACQTDLAKAVPVPAFAAAALGLGLMGITYLTSRRRKVS